MARFDLAAWLKNADALGARFSSRDLRGALGLFTADRLKVPEGVSVLVRYEDGSQRLLKPGDEAVGGFEGVAVKARYLALDVRLEGLLTREDLPFSFFASVEVGVDWDDADAVRDFGGFFLADRPEAGVAEIRDLLLPDIEEALKNFAAGLEAEALARGDRSAEIEGILRAALRRSLFEGGLVLDEVKSASFHSDHYERILGDKIEATVEEERSKRREIIRAAWVKDQKDEILSSKEVQDLVRALEHEGALKEIERRREKLEAEKQLQSLAQRATEDKLAEEARTASNLVKILEEAGFKNVFEKFLHIAREEVQVRPGATASGFDPKLHGVPEGRTRRLLCAVGKQVLGFRPDSTAPVDRYPLGTGSLGMIRSVQLAEHEGEEVILAGAQFGVYLLREGGSRLEFPIPSAGDKRGGVNGACIHRGALFATHSDYGLIRWALPRDEDAEAPGEFVRRDLTEGRKTVRGVQMGPLDRLFFASGSEVFSLLPESLDGTATVFSGAGDSVTSLVLTERTVFAGTAGGEVLRWELASPDVAPRREIAKRPDPIFMLKTSFFNGLPHLLVGWKGYAVLADTLEMDMEVSYPSDVRIRWVDGASDCLYGVDRDGRRLLVWEAGNPRARPMEIRTEERIQDLCVWRDRPPA